MSVAPIENPRDSYPLEKRPIALNMVSARKMPMIRLAMIDSELSRWLLMCSVECDLLLRCW